ncbi:MAG: YhdT family protein [Eubacteriales bacterium]|nr:YhdT family protein [Eubacteriales bacterium]
MNNKMSREEKDIQIRKEAKATVILFAICFVWNVACAYGLSGCSIRILGLPLWWILSTPGVFVIAVVGVIFLVRKVFVDFDLEEESEGGADHAE